MIDQNFVYEQVAEFCGVPCKWSTKAASHMYQHSQAWCKKFCGKVDAGKCVRQLMRTLEIEERKNATRVR